MTEKSSIKIDDEKSKFIENIKKWVAIDTQIKRINEKTAHIRKIRCQIVDEIGSYVTKHNIIDKTIEITDGELSFYEKKEYQALSYKYLEECLMYFIKDPCHIEIIMGYMKDNRKVKNSVDIRRYYQT
jgi:uncharacterized protein YllA (UPF0747 family)